MKIVRTNQTPNEMFELPEAVLQNGLGSPFFHSEIYTTLDSGPIRIDEAAISELFSLVEIPTEFKTEPGPNSSDTVGTDASTDAIAISKNNQRKRSKK